MANTNSTPAITDLIQSANDYCVNMQAFFDLAEREIKNANTTDVGGIEFLLKAAKAEFIRFGRLVWDAQEREVHHA